jgi:hypothetical protein
MMGSSVVWGAGPRDRTTTRIPSVVTTIEAAMMRKAVRKGTLF